MYLTHAMSRYVPHFIALAASSPYDVKVPTVLSGAKHKAAARRRVGATRHPDNSHQAPT